MDLVSIITPLYNGERFIAETIESVLSQTYKNWELIIINDCSTDNSLDIVNKYAYKDTRIKVINLKRNGGPVNAWNVAFDYIEGRYLSFLDSDDIWIPTKIEEQINFMKKNNIGFCFASYDWIDENSKSLNRTINVPQKMTYNDMLKNTNIGLLTVMLDLDLVHFEKLPIVKMAWDFLLWAKIMKTGVIAYGYNKVIAHYRIRSKSASRNKFKAAKGLWIIYKDYLKIPPLKRFFYFLNYILNSLKRYYL